MGEVKRFYNLVQNGDVADLDIYGDIVCEAWAWDESDMNVFRLSRKLEELQGVRQINVNINSYGGEVAEGIAIYNALVRHDAKIVTRCDGMACSIASVIFMAGEERIMYEPSMLMIHNASSFAWGTAAELRKAAEDNDKITSMSKAAYMQCVNITEEELTDLMDAETWISPAEALNMGFATAIESRVDDGTVSQSARASMFKLIERGLEDTPSLESAIKHLGEAVAIITEAAQADEPDDDDEQDDDDEEITVDGDQDDTEEDPEQDPDSDSDEDDEDDDDGEKKSEQAFRSFVMAAYE